MLAHSLENRLQEIFQQAYLTYCNLESRLKAENYKLRVLQIFKAWDDWAVYPRDFLLKLKATFLGTPITVSPSFQVFYLVFKVRIAFFKKRTY